MSDELDDHLRDERWRRVCPDITDGEIDALARLPESEGRQPHLVRMLAAYRAGRIEHAPGCAGLSFDQYVSIRLPDDSVIVGKVKYMASQADGVILAQAGPEGRLLGHQMLDIGRTQYPRTPSGFRELNPLPHTDARWPTADVKPPGPPIRFSDDSVDGDDAPGYVKFSTPLTGSGPARTEYRRNDRDGHHRDCTWLGPHSGWRCIRGCTRLESR